MWVLNRGFDLIKTLAQAVFFFSLTVIPLTALKPHDQRVIPYEMWLGSALKQFCIGLVRS